MPSSSPVEILIIPSVGEESALVKENIPSKTPVLGPVSVRVRTIPVELLDELTTICIVLSALGSTFASPSADSNFWAVF